MTAPRQPAPVLRAASSWRLLALLTAMTAVGPVTLNILVPALPSLVLVLHTDMDTVQLTLSLYLISIAISQLLLGPLSDRFGRRPVVLAGLALNLLASLAAVAAASIGALIVTRVLQAAGAATGIVMGRTIIRDLYERDRAASMIGVVTTAMVVAPMVAPLIGGILDTLFGWESIFLFVAALSALVLLWAVPALPETRPAGPTGSSGLFWPETRALFGSPKFHAYVLAGAFGSAPFFTFLGGSPHVAVTLMNISSAEYGLWFVLNSFGYMIGNFTTSRLSQRFGVDAMIAGGIAVQLVGTGITCALIAAYPDGGPAPVFLPQCVISFGIGVVLPNAIAGAVSVRPTAAGTAAGVAGFAQMALGALLTQFVTALLVGATTAMPMAALMLAEVVATALVFAVLVRGRARDTV